MKKLLALLLAMVMVLSMAACGNEDHKKDEDDEDEDELVNVWLLTSETQYEADGSRGYSKNTYTYTEDGLPLTAEYDRGLTEEVWNDTEFVYESILLPFNDTPDQKIEFFYNQQGDLTGRADTYWTYDEQGDLEDTRTNEYGKYAYHYDEYGRISSVDSYNALIDGGYSDEIGSVLHCCYDDDGQLVEVYKENKSSGEISWCYDYRYNEAGQLTDATQRPLEGVIHRRYQYNDEGALIRVFENRAAYNQTPLDDQHVVQSENAHGDPMVDREFDGIWGDIVLEYDEQGRLVSRNGDKITYDADGRISRVDYNSPVVYVDDEADADPDAITFVRDENGNVVKIIDAAGSYIELEYQLFQLSEKQAEKVRNIRDMTNWKAATRTDREMSFFRFQPGNAFMVYMPLVRTALTDTDYLYDRYFY